MSRSTMTAPHAGPDTITLASGELEATFVPSAGMVCSSLLHAGEEVLGQRGGLREYATAGRTMGIPLLHPWANRLGDWEYDALGRRVDLRRLEGSVVKADGATGLPIHGALPGAWQVTARTAAALTAEQHRTWDAGFEAAFPYDHRMRLEARLEDGALRITTTVIALDARVPVAFGFHPYLTLPGVPRERYELALPPLHPLALDDRSVPTGEVGEPVDLSGPLGERTFDDGFDGVPDGAALAISGGGRRIEVRFERGFGCAQVFAPPGKDHVCFEPMTAPTNALRAGGFAVATPQEPYVAAFAVAVSADGA